MINLNSAPIKIQNYQYKGFHGNDCSCPLYVWPDKNLVIVQHGENAYPSPMQMAEKLAHKAINEFKLDVKKTTWINHVPIGFRPDNTEEFTFLNFTIKKKLFSSNTDFLNADFNHVNKDSVADCIEGKLKFKVKHKISYSLS